MEKITHNYYDDSNTINYFNHILNGRWHTGLDCTTMGQIQMEELLIKKLKISQTDRVLDFGCGVGLVSCDIHLMTGCQITGLNISPKQIKLSRQLANKLKLSPDKVNFVLNSNATILPFPDNSFDKIIFFESICHVDNRKQLFQEFNRILKPNGLFGGQDWIQTDMCSHNPEIYQKYINPICQTYKIPSLMSINHWSVLLRSNNFMPIELVDMNPISKIGSSFDSHYFRNLSVISLLKFLISYIWSYLRIKIKYPKVQMKYSLNDVPDHTPEYDDKENKGDVDYSGDVLNQAYTNKAFSIGLILAKKDSIGT